MQFVSRCIGGWNLGGRGRMFRGYIWLGNMEDKESHRAKLDENELIGSLFPLTTIESTCNPFVNFASAWGD